MPKQLTPTEQDVYNVIRTHVGPERAVTAQRIADLCGISDARTVREIIERLVHDHGHGEILARTESPAGYFWASCRQDIDHYANTLYRRARDILRRRKYTKLARLRLPDQRPIQPTLL